MTKNQIYIKRYGSAMNFYGGTGESAHKQFVKAPGQNAQRRVSEFASQTAQQFYDILVTNHALHLCANEITIKSQCHTDVPSSNHSIDDVSFDLKGKYTLEITTIVKQHIMNGDDIEVAWRNDRNKVKKNNKLYFINKDLINSLTAMVSYMRPLFFELRASLITFLN